MATIKNIYTTDVNAEDYLEGYLEENNLDLEEYTGFEEVHKEDLWEYANNERQIEYGDAIENIRCHEKSHGKKTYVIKATIGLWDGTHEGGRVIEGMESVICACSEEVLDIYLEGRQMTIKASHHDGTNMFFIKELTKEGERYYELHFGEMSREDMVEKLFNNRHLSRHVTIWKELYGM